MVLLVCHGDKTQPELVAAPPPPVAETSTSPCILESQLLSLHRKLSPLYLQEDRPAPGFSAPALT